MSIRIEAADADDADEIVELWVALARDQRAYGSHLLGDSNREQIRDAIARHIVTDGLRVARVPDEATSVGVAIDGDDAPPDSIDSEADITGFVMFDIETGVYAQNVTRGIVRNLYVRPSCRDEGVGTALLSAAEDTLAAAGADVVSLEAMMTNEDARRFYTDQGYSPHRVEFEKHLDGGASDRSDTHSREDS